MISPRIFRKYNQKLKHQLTRFSDDKTYLVELILILLLLLMVFWGINWL